MQILIVDDSSMMRRQVASTLTAAGYTVAEACDGEDAREKLAAAPETKLVVCDVTMPRMSGLELLEVLHDERRLPALPVVMLTTEGRPELVQRARSLGARGWLVKPLKPEMLLAVVAKLLRG